MCAFIPGAVYTSTPADVPDPPFRFFKGLVPRLASLCIGRGIRGGYRVLDRRVCFQDASVRKHALLGGSGGIPPPPRKFLKKMASSERHLGGFSSINTA